MHKMAHQDKVNDHPIKIDIKILVVAKYDLGIKKNLDEGEPQ